MFADPLFLTPSLSNNPFLGDRFGKDDALEKKGSNDKTADSKPSQKYSRSCSNVISLKRDQKVDHAKNGTQDKNPYIDIIRDNTWQRLADPFNDDDVSLQRLEQIAAVAQAIHRDEKQRDDFKAHQSVSQPNSNLDDRIIEYILDPFNDDELDLKRVERVTALAKPLLQENPNNHIIQIVPISENFTNSKPEILYGDLNNVVVAKNIAAKDQEKPKPKFLEILKNNVTHIHDVQQQFAQVHIWLKQTERIANNQQKNNKSTFYDNYLRGVLDFGFYKADASILQNNSEVKLLGISEPSEKNDKLIAEMGYLAGKATADILMQTAYLALTTFAPGPVLLFESILSTLTQAMPDHPLINLFNAGLDSSLNNIEISLNLNSEVQKLLPHASNQNCKLGQTIIVTPASTKAEAQQSVAKFIEFLEKAPAIANKVPILCRYVKRAQALATAGVVIFSIAKNYNIYKSLNQQLITSDAKIGEVVDQAIDNIVAKQDKTSNSFKEFEAVLDNVDNVHECVKRYENFIYRAQIRQLLQNLQFSAEAIEATIQKIPFYKQSIHSSIEGIVDQAHRSQSILLYCNNHKVCSWIKNKLIEINLPFEKHYIFSDQCQNLSLVQEFQQIINHYKLNPSANWNVVRIPKPPKIAEEYYEWIISELKNIHQDIQSTANLDDLKKQKLFLEQYKNRIKIPLNHNPLICSKKWYKFWKEDKYLFDQQQKVLIKDTENAINLSLIEKVEINKPIQPVCYKLQKDLQFKHFKEGGAIKDKKSLVYWNYEKIIAKTEPLIGRGISVDEKKFGEVDFKEVVKFDEICGEAFDRDTNMWVETQYAKIHYKLDGNYHIVPIKPESSYAKKWEDLYGKI